MVTHHVHTVQCRTLNIQGRAAADPRYDSYENKQAAGLATEFPRARVQKTAARQKRLRNAQIWGAVVL